MKIERKGKAKLLSFDEMEEIMTELRQPYHAIYSVQRYTGARISEVIQLKRVNINLEKKVIVLEVLKGKKIKYRQLVIHKCLLPILKEYLQERNFQKSDYIFPGNKGIITGNRVKIQGNHITAQACDKALRNVCDYIGLVGVSTHSFRRTVINNIWNNMENKDIRLLCAFTGHESVSSLLHYLDIDEAQLKNVINLVE